jgi:hypothetical protein
MQKHFLSCWRRLGLCAFVLTSLTVVRTLWGCACGCDIFVCLLFIRKADLNQSMGIRPYISSALLQLFCFIEHLEPFRGFHLRRISGREAWRRNIRVLGPLFAQVPFAFHIQL